MVDIDTYGRRNSTRYLSGKLTPEECLTVYNMDWQEIKVDVWRYHQQKLPQQVNGQTTSKACGLME